MGQLYATLVFSEGIGFGLLANFYVNVLLGLSTPI
jgi:hypothetical protein